MENKQYDESYVNMLKEELNSAKDMAKALVKIIAQNQNQCIIKWDWDQIFEFPRGRVGRINLEELITEAIEQKYSIVSVTIIEYDETGSPLHALIIASYPEGGKLHQ
jgi:uncharacterized protein YvpB